MCKNWAGNYSRIIGLILMSVLLIACEVTIESPTDTTFYEGQEIHFAVEYNGVGTVLWRSEYTVPGDSSGTVYTISNSEFKDGVTGVGKGYPWEFKKSNLPVGVHKITVYKNEDTAKITITILPFCDNPELNCSSYGDGVCKIGICDNDEKKCTTINATSEVSCDDNLMCTQNDQCVGGSCTGNDICPDGMHCSEVGCVSYDLCEDSAFCQKYNTGCLVSYCDESQNVCVIQHDRSESCDDGLSCNGLEKCSLETASCYTAVEHPGCMDGYICSDPDGYCVPESCDDGIECTQDIGDTINGCTHNPLNEYCDDGLSCTDDMCDSQFGCVNVSNCYDEVMGAGGQCLSDSTCLFEGEREWVALVPSAEEGALPVINITGIDECISQTGDCMEWEIILKGVWTNYKKYNGQYYIDIDIPGGSNDFVPAGYPEVDEYLFSLDIPTYWDISNEEILSSEFESLAVQREYYFPKQNGIEFTTVVSEEEIPEKFPEEHYLFKLSKKGMKGGFRPVIFDSKEDSLIVYTHLKIKVNVKKVIGEEYLDDKLSSFFGGSTSILDNLDFTIATIDEGLKRMRETKNQKFDNDNGFCTNYNSRNYDCFITDGVRRWAPDEPHGCPTVDPDNPIANVYITNESQLIIDGCDDITLNNVFVGYGIKESNVGQCSIPMGACNTDHDCGHYETCIEGECIWPCTSSDECMKDICNPLSQECSISGVECGDKYCLKACNLNTGYCVGSDVRCGSKGCSENYCNGKYCSESQVWCGCGEITEISCPEPVCNETIGKCEYYDSDTGEKFDTQISCQDTSECPRNDCNVNHCVLTATDCRVGQKTVCNHGIGRCIKEDGTSTEWKCGDAACDANKCEGSSGECTISDEICSCGDNTCEYAENDITKVQCSLNGVDCGRCPENICEFENNDTNILPNNGSLAINDSNVRVRSVLVRSDREISRSSEELEQLPPSKFIVTESTISFYDPMFSMVLLAGNSRMFTEKATLKPAYDINYETRSTDYSNLLVNQWFGIWVLGYDYDYESGSFACSRIQNPSLDPDDMANGAGLWMSKFTNIVGARAPALAMGLCLEDREWKELAYAEDNIIEPIPGDRLNCVVGSGDMDWTECTKSSWRLSPSFGYIHIDGSTENDNTDVPTGDFTSITFDIIQSSVVNYNVAYNLYTTNLGVTALKLKPSSILLDGEGGLIGESLIDGGISIRKLRINYNPRTPFSYSNADFLDPFLNGTLLFLYKTEVPVYGNTIVSQLDLFEDGGNLGQPFPVMYTLPHFVIWKNKEKVILPYGINFDNPSLAPTDIYVLDPLSDVVLPNFTRSNGGDVFDFYSQCDFLPSYICTSKFKKTKRNKYFIEFTEPFNKCDDYADLDLGDILPERLRQIKIADEDNKKWSFHYWKDEEDYGIIVSSETGYPNEGWASIVNSGSEPLDPCTEIILGSSENIYIARNFKESYDLYSGIDLRPVITLEGGTESPLRNIAINNITIHTDFTDFLDNELYPRLWEIFNFSGIYIKNTDNLDINNIGTSGTHSPPNPIVFYGNSNNVYVRNNIFNYHNWEKGYQSLSNSCVSVLAGDESQIEQCDMSECEPYCGHALNEGCTECIRYPGALTCTCLAKCSDSIHCDGSSDSRPECEENEFCLFNHIDLSLGYDSQVYICHENDYLPDTTINEYSNFHIFCNEFSKGCGEKNDNGGFSSLDIYSSDRSFGEGYLGYGNYYHTLDSGTKTDYYNPEDYMQPGEIYGMCLEGEGPGRDGIIGIPRSNNTAPCYDMIDTCWVDDFPITCGEDKPLWSCDPVEGLQ